MNWVSLQQCANKWFPVPGHSISNAILYPYSHEIIQHVDQLDVFLRDLLQNLKKCKTVRECTQKYPSAGSLLTSLSHNKILLLYPSTTFLLLSCLFAYTKTCNVLSSPFNAHDISKSWALSRLRQTFTSHTHDSASNAVAEICGIGAHRFSQQVNKEQSLAIADYIEQLEKFPITLPTEELENIAAMCVPLMKSGDTTGTTRILLKYILKRNVRLKLDTLIEEVVFNDKDFFAVLNEDDQARIYIYYPPSLERAILNLIQPHLDHIYIPRYLLRQNIICQPFINFIARHPELYIPAAEVAVSICCSEPGGDWRVWKVVAEILFVLGELYCEIPSENQEPSSILSLIRHLHTKTLVHTATFQILSEIIRHALYLATPDELPRRQKIVWFLILSVPKWRLGAMEILVQADHIDMDGVVKFLSWWVSPVWKRECEMRELQKTISEIDTAKYADVMEFWKCVRKVFENDNIFLVELAVVTWRQFKEDSRMLQEMIESMLTMTVTPLAQLPSSGTINLTVASIILDVLDELKMKNLPVLQEIKNQLETLLGC